MEGVGHDNSELAEATDLDLGTEFSSSPESIGSVDNYWHRDAVLAVGCASETGWLWVSQRPKQASSPPTVAKWLSTMQTLVAGIRERDDHMREARPSHGATRTARCRLRQCGPEDGG